MIGTPSPTFPGHDLMAPALAGHVKFWAAAPGGKSTLDVTLVLPPPSSSENETRSLTTENAIKNRMGRVKMSPIEHPLGVCPREHVRLRHPPTPVAETTSALVFSLGGARMLCVRDSLPCKLEFLVVFSTLSTMRSTQTILVKQKGVRTLRLQTAGSHAHERCVTVVDQPACAGYLCWSACAAPTPGFAPIPPLPYVALVRLRQTGVYVSCWTPIALTERPGHPYVIVS